MVHTSSSSFTLHLPLSRRDWTSCNLPSLAASSRSLIREVLAAACVISSSQSMKEDGRYMTKVRVRPGMHIRIWKSHIMVQIKSQGIYYTVLLVSLMLGQEQMPANKEGKQVWGKYRATAHWMFHSNMNVHSNVEKVWHNKLKLYNITKCNKMSALPTGRLAYVCMGNVN